MDLEWMAWTPVTAGFFITICFMLVGMTVWEIVSPTKPRRGLLPLTTTRGDRFFIGLLGSAYITISWIALSDVPLWYALPLLFAFLILTMRYG